MNWCYCVFLFELVIKYLFFWWVVVVFIGYVLVGVVIFVIVVLLVFGLGKFVYFLEENGVILILVMCLIMLEYVLFFVDVLCVLFFFINVIRVVYLEM